MSTGTKRSWRPQSSSSGGAVLVWLSRSKRAGAVAPLGRRAMPMLMARRALAAVARRAGRAMSC